MNFQVSEFANRTLPVNLDKMKSLYNDFIIDRILLMNCREYQKRIYYVLKEGVIAGSDIRWQFLKRRTCPFQ